MTIMQDVLIERAELADAEPILALQKLAFESQAQLYNDWTLPPLIEKIEDMQNAFTDHVFFKAVIHDEIVGSVRGASTDETCQVERLIVHPDWQRRGIALRLMHELENYFQSCRRFALHTGYKSHRSINLYEKLGYRQYDTGIQNDHVHIVYMEKMR